MKYRNKILAIIFLALSCNATKYTFHENLEEAATITYNKDVKNIVENYCISCHSGIFPASGFTLTSYSKVRHQAEHGELLNRINDKQNPMPEGGLMPKEIRTVFEKWAKSGFVEGQEIIDSSQSSLDAREFLNFNITAVNLNEKGFDFFELMQGHWVGEMNIMGTYYEWFSFDYRPITSSHVHGIFEGGSMGNLFTSFFIADFNGTKTILVRNGGILNGIYRTSYFVLDHAEITKERKYFRFVDVYGDKEIMWMELEFIGNKIEFNSYTSRFGLSGKPTLHMKFNATKRHTEISQDVSDKLNYPQNQIERSFPNGLPSPIWSKEYGKITSASYIYQDLTEDLVSLGKLSGDPYPIDEIPYISSLTVQIEQNQQIKDEPIIIYLSKDALTDKTGQMISEYGFISQELFDGVLSFPELKPNQREFTFYYLHPGDYYITVVADVNRDGYISEGDIYSESRAIIVKPEEHLEVLVKQMGSQN